MIWHSHTDGNDRNGLKSTYSSCSRAMKISSQVEDEACRSWSSATSHRRSFNLCRKAGSRLTVGSSSDGSSDPSLSKFSSQYHSINASSTELPHVREASILHSTQTKDLDFKRPHRMGDKDSEMYVQHRRYKSFQGGIPQSGRVLGAVL